MAVLFFSRSLLLLQGTVRQGKVSIEQSVLIARFQITNLMHIYIPLWWMCGPYVCIQADSVFLTSSFYLRSRQSQVYPLMFGSQKISVFCHMGNFGCGDGGWTLAMKIDGVKVNYLLLL